MVRSKYLNMVFIYVHIHVVYTFSDQFHFDFPLSDIHYNNNLTQGKTNI